MPSVVEPLSEPSCTTTVLTLPASAACSSTSCRWGTMSTLNGRVTLKPERASAGIAARKPSNDSAWRGT